MERHLFVIRGSGVQIPQPAPMISISYELSISVLGGNLYQLIVNGSQAWYTVGSS